MADVFGVGQIVSSLINTIGNATINNINNEEASAREANARRENFYYNELAAGRADKRTRKLFTDLYSPTAKIKQLKEAGLSPSLYANAQNMGAGIGSSGAQGAGAAGILGQTFGAQPFAIDFSKAAEANLNQALARKANAEADTIDGKNERGQAEISNIVADTSKKLSEKGYNEASTALKNAENAWQNIQNYVSEETKEYNIYQITSNAEIAGWEAKQAYVDYLTKDQNYRFDAETYGVRKEQIVANYKNTLADTILKEAKTEEAKVNKQYLANKIAEIWKNLELQQMITNAEQDKAHAMLLNASTERFKYATMVKVADAQTKQMEAHIEQEWKRILQEDEKIKQMWERIEVDKQRVLMQNMFGFGMFMNYTAQMY